MKDKPQTIKTTVWTEFTEMYIKQLMIAMKRKFKIDIGIEPDFLNTGGQSELVIRFLSTDDTATDIYEFMLSKWQFVKEPELI